MAEANVPAQEDNQLNIDQTVNSAEANELFAATGGTADTGGEEVVDLDDLDLDDEGQEDRQGRVDNELAAANTAEERQQIIADRKNRNRDRRQRQKDRYESLQREIQQVRRENQELAQRLARGENFQRSTQYQELERAEAEVDTVINTIERALESAGRANDGVQIAKLTKDLVQAQNAKERLAAGKTQFVENTRREVNRPAPADPNLVRNANAWRAKNPWFQGSRSTDLDSQIATSIDEDMARNGWSPSTDGYWVEFDKRCRQRLPHRYESSSRGEEGSDNSRQQNTGGERRQSTRQPVAGGGNAGGGSQGNKRQFTVSTERVRAMKESGAWFDPARKAKMIKDYMEYDKKHGIAN